MGAGCTRRCCPSFKRSGSLEGGGHRGQQSTVGDMPEFDHPLYMDPSPTSSAFMDPMTGSRISSDGASSTDDVFVSMLSDAEFSHALLSLRTDGSAKRLEPSIKSASAPARTKRSFQNANRISSYRWLEEILRLIAEGRAAGASFDTVRQPRRRATPLFVVAGTCPNSMCSMQAVTYFGFDDGSIDLWWVKPKQSDKNQLEHGTLNLQNRGPFKNDAGGRARAVYAPLAEKFAGRGTVEDDFAFGVDKASGRAFIEDRAASRHSSNSSNHGPSSSTTGEGRLLLYLVWQERWSSGMLGKKFIAGKLVYQKTAGDVQASAPAGFFSRQYKITNGELFIAPREEEESVPTLLPPDSFQEMYDMDV